MTTASSTSSTPCCPPSSPLERFYQELGRTQAVLNRKHLGLAARLLLRGQTNFVRMLWKFNSVYNPARQLADHRQPVRYQMRLPVAPTNGKSARRAQFVLAPQPAERPAVAVR